jgi:hypothetical protein
VARVGTVHPLPLSRRVRHLHRRRAHRSLLRRCHPPSSFPHRRPPARLTDVSRPARA